MSADHDEPAAIATLVGSLQSELGCPDDWSPPCPVTAMQQGDDGSWSITVDVPAGSWEWKVALDGTWDRSYPTSNVLLVLEGAAQLTFSYDDTSHQVAVAPASTPEGVNEDDQALAGTSLRDDLTRERFYFVMADRFDNGDPTNDTGGIAGDRLANGFDPTDKGFYHGGDIAGLTAQLDYIEGLGTTAIWLTPAFKNRPVQGAEPDISAGYHGYWITDFTQIDPHLGTNDELRTLVDEAHARGIKVFFDIITNHTADVIDYAEGSHTYIDKATEPYIRSDTLEPFDDRDFAGTANFPPLDPAVSFPYTPVFRTTADETVKVPAWLNDRRYYHNRGDSTFAGESSEYGDFFGLDDLFTEHPDVVAGMTEIYQAWVAFGVDGFRIDTVKHVNVEFWQTFAAGIAAAAEAAGNDDFFAFGEVFDENPSFMSRYTTEAGLQATIDFGFQAKARGFGEGRPTVELRDLFANDDYYTDTDSNAYSLPTFLGNHDMGRIGKFIADSGASGDELLARDRLTHSLMYLSRGQPVVYYGDEQGFIGDGGDKDARQDMFPSQVASYNDDDLIGTDATTADANFDPGHPVYQHLADLSRLRSEHPALADGAQVHRYASDDAGVFAFSRIDADDEREYLVALNNSEIDQTVTFDTFSERGKFRGLWPATTGDVRSDREGRVTVAVPALGAAVWRATSDLKHQKHAPSMYFRTPGPGGTVGGRAEVGVSVPDGGFNQVTLAWRPAGTDAWSALGTDDNAPYRVFHDVTGLAAGTLVEYRAVLRDHSGNLSVAQTYATVGDPPPPGGGGGGGGGPVMQPDAVSVPGTANDEMGCPGEWQPECDQAQLTLDPDDQIWKGTYDLPAGNYFFKVAIDRAWTENYGAGAVPGGADIPFTHPGGPVTFYYDHGTHWVTNDVLSEIITAPGSAQSELGCPADWSPDCMRPWLQDPDGDGTWTWSTTEIPAGSYEVKVAHGLSWDENYGAGGAPNGSNIAYTVPADGVLVTFSYVLSTHVLTVTTSRAGPAPDLDTPKAHWLERGLLAWDLPPEASTWHFRLHAAPTGGLTVDAEAILGGESFPLTFDPDGLPADVREQWPHLAAYDALELSRHVARDVDELLTGQLAVAAYDDLGRLVDATGVQIPGVLDDVYDDAYDRQLGVTWQGSRPKLAVWAPTAKDVDLLLRLPGAPTDRLVQMHRDGDGVWSVRGDRDWEDASYLFEVDVYAPAEGAVVTNTVTDPYALALTTDSARAVIVDLDD
ncbi:MAG: alpha-amylase family glycosyl hydrolase, partial [Ilumatobacteraceae bacterium]